MINTIRHQQIFTPEEWPHRIDVIGVGATGSRVALSLAKLGVRDIHVWDPDVVEDHNIANQAYGLEDVGRPKVEALTDMVLSQTGIQLTPHPERVDGSQRLGSVVYLLTDTMASREEIWRGGIRLKPRIKLMIETRMGVDNGRIYAVVPTKRDHIAQWEGTLYSDEEAEVSACGTPITVGPTAELVSALAVWQMIRWWNIEQSLRQGEAPEDDLEHEVVFSVKPMIFLNRDFATAA